MSPFGRQRTLFLLTAMYGFGFTDRVVIALVAQDMKTDLRISDFQIGLLGGLAFALVNTLAALPLARLSERCRRTTIVGVSLAVGSAFTMICAGAMSFWQMLFLRMGVGIGSAGTEAPAHSIISDLYDRGRRSSAIAVFSLGVPVASIAGAYVSAKVGHNYGWRATFLVLGAPGILLGLLGLALMIEPPREAAVGDEPAPPLRSVIARLWGDSGFRHLLAGASLVSFASFGINTFLPIFMVRNYGLNVADAGLSFGLIVGIASGLGTLLGGFGAERLARRDARWLLRAPALGFVVGAPILMAGVAQATASSGIVLLFLGSFFFYTWMGPAIATTHGLLDSRTRASGSALFLLVIHFVGQGLGPPAIGFASDTMAASLFNRGNFATICAGASGNPACVAASAGGIRYAMMLFILVYLGAAILFIRAARGLPATGASYR